MQLALKNVQVEKILAVAFCLVTALIPLLSINVPRSYAYVPGISGLLFFGLFYLLGNEKPRISTKTAIFVLTTLVIASLSILWAKYFDVSKAKVLKLLALLPLQLLLISLVTSLKDLHLKPLAKILPYTFLAATALLIFEILSKGTLHNIVRGLPYDTITDHDNFNRGSVALALYAFPVFGLLALRMNKWAAAVIIFLPVTTAVFLSQSQSSQLALIVGLFILATFPYKSDFAIKTLKWLILILMATAPFFVSYIFENFADTLVGIDFFKRGYAGDRLEMWTSISKYTMSQPILGHGIEVTRAVTDFQSEAKFWPINQTLHPHNFVIQIWVEFGTIGIIVAMGLMYACITSIEKNFSVKQRSVILPTFVATLVPAALAYGLWQGLWIGLMFHVAAITLIVCKLVVSEE